MVYAANENYYRGAPKLKRIVFREMPTSSNRVAALQAGAVDVAEWLLPRELSLLQQAPGVKVWKVFGNYIHRIEMNNAQAPFNDVRVRQAMNYLVPRDDIAKSVYYGTARPTRSPVSEIYPGFTDEGFPYTYDPEKAKQLLAEAGLPNGFKTQLGYRTGDEIEEQIAVILRTSFAKAGVDVELEKMPSSSLVAKYTKAELPMYYLRDMAIVPDAAYVVNLWLNSASMVDYSRFKDPAVDQLINSALTSTDEAKRVADMQRAQHMVVDEGTVDLPVQPRLPACHSYRRAGVLLVHAERQRLVRLLQELSGRGSRVACIAGLAAAAAGGSDRFRSARAAGAADVRRHSGYLPAGPVAARRPGAAACSVTWRHRMRFGCCATSWASMVACSNSSPTTSA